MLNSSCCKVNFLFESRIEDPLENEMAHLKGLFLFNKCQIYKKYTCTYFLNIYMHVWVFIYTN